MSAADSEIKSYNKDIEDLFINYMVSSPDLFIRCKGIMKPSYFDDKVNKEAVGFMMGYADEFASLPSIEQIKAITKKDVTLVIEEASKHDTWFLREFETFARHKALRAAILAAPDLLEEGRYGEVEYRVKEAVQIGLVKDLGTDYYANPKQRLEAIKSGNGQVSIGWKAVDDKLYGGLNRGEITIFAGQCVVADTIVMATKKLDVTPFIKHVKLDYEIEKSAAERVRVYSVLYRYENRDGYDTDNITDPKLKYLSQFYTGRETLCIGELGQKIVDHLYNAMQPKEYKIIEINGKDWYIESPDGMVPVIDLICKGKEDIINVLFTDGTHVNASPFHPFERVDGVWLASVNLNPGDEIIAKGGPKTVLGITDTNYRELVYDLAVDHDNHRYYTNGVSSHNSGAGKSVFLQNIAVNWAERGMNVVYLSLELSEKLCSMRIDSMTSGFGTREVMKNIDQVHMRVTESHKRHKGTLRIKQMPNGCTANDIRAYIKEYEVQTGVRVDAIMVDYLDLCSPINRKISAENLFVKDKYVAEELRNLAVELNTLLVTASQLGRCLAPYTEVETEDRGIIEIKDVVVGDKLKSHDGFKEVKNVWPEGKKQVYKIKTKSGKEIVCSSNHRFPTSDELASIDSGLTLSTTLSIDSNAVMDQIISIEEFGEEYTIDIEVEGDHLFYANGILTHNTSYDTVDFDASNIAGGISKVNTADNVIGIHTSPSMRESGRYQLQFIKTRSSSGVGSKVDLVFDQATLRIKDMEDGDMGADAVVSMNIQDKLRRTSVISNPVESLPPPASFKTSSQIKAERTGESTTSPSTELDRVLQMRKYLNPK